MLFKFMQSDRFYISLQSDARFSAVFCRYLFNKSSLKKSTQCIQTSLQRATHWYQRPFSLTNMGMGGGQFKTRRFSRFLQISLQQINPEKIQKIRKILFFIVYNITDFQTIWCRLIWLDTQKKKWFFISVKFFLNWPLFP